MEAATADERMTQGIFPVSQTPTGFTDFTMFSGNTPPANGVYFADDGVNLWVLYTGRTPIQWRQAVLLSAWLR